MAARLRHGDLGFHVSCTAHHAYDPIAAKIVVPVLRSTVLADTACVDFSESSTAGSELASERPHAVTSRGPARPELNLRQIGRVRGLLGVQHGRR